MLYFHKEIFLQVTQVDHHSQTDIFFSGYSHKLSFSHISYAEKIHSEKTVYFYSAFKDIQIWRNIAADQLSCLENSRHH